MDQAITDWSVAEIGARLDRLPPSRTMWRWVGVLSFGAFFEIYDISLTAFLSPALLKAGIFHMQGGLFGLNDQANFVFATFFGLWLGTLLFAAVADRLGRRPVFTLSLVWYAAATVVMGFASSAAAIDALRALAGIGIGVQLVAIDCILAELLPKAQRGRGFAVSTFLQFLAVPVGGVLSLLLTKHVIHGVVGWRFLAFIPGLAAIGIVFLGRFLPESPRWLARQGRQAEAVARLDAIEAAVRRETGRELSPPSVEARSVAPAAAQRTAALFQPPLRRIVLMLIVFHLFQTIGFFGFSNWAPMLLEARGVALKSSLAYTTAIALAFPLSPLLFLALADRIERKWLIVMGALGAAAAGLFFAASGNRVGWIGSGFLLTIFSGLMSFAYHTYQGELFPTALRARAVGFVYSFSRLAAMFSGYIVAAILKGGGAGAVFVSLAGCFLAVTIVIGIFGPRTTRASLEAIAG